MVADDGPVFPVSEGRFRDSQNVEQAFRAVRERHRVRMGRSSHRPKDPRDPMDLRGLSARTIADQLGHSRISMTQDVYLGRRAVDSAALPALEAVIRRSDVARGDEDTSPRDAEGP